MDLGGIQDRKRTRNAGGVGGNGRERGGIYHRQPTMAGY